MKTSQIDNGFIIKRLLEHWDFDPNANACILASRVTHEVLSYFGVPHAVMPTQAIAMNEMMLSHVMAGTPHSEWHAEAWSVGVGFPNMVATNRDNRDPVGFDGHLIVTTRVTLIDLSAGQFDRPAYGIVTGGPMTYPLSQISNESVPGFGDKKFLHINLKEGHLFLRPFENDAYKMSKDYRVNYTRLASPIIRAIKQDIKNL